VPFDVNSQEVDVAGESKFAVGDHVWVKPAPAFCTKRWAPGQITGITSKHTVCVNGVPQHMRDVKTRRYEGSQECSWCEPEILCNASAGKDDLGLGQSLAQVPEDAVTDLIGRNVEETLRLDKRPDAGETERVDAVGTRPVGVGEHRAVDQVEVAEEQLPVQLERPQRVWRQPAYLSDYDC